MNKKKKIILRWILAVVLMSVGIGLIVSTQISNSRDEELKNQEAATLELNVPTLANATGGFAVDSTGKAISQTEQNSEIPRVEFILDLHCGGCKQVETGVNETMKQKMESEEAQFVFTPVSFMNKASTDDYSARAASTLVEVAETDSEHFFDYLTALYENFPPEGANYPRAGFSYEDLARVAKSAGVSDEAIAKFEEQRFRLWALENTAVVEARTEIFPSGISTPTVLMGGELKELEGKFVLEGFTRATFRDPDVAKTFREAFDTVK